MKTTVEFLKAITKERPVGTNANNDVLKIFKEEAHHRGCDSILLPFVCKVWERSASVISAGSSSYEVFPSPFSGPFDGKGCITAVHSVEELASKDLKDSIVLLLDDISKEPLMPKDFPFYYPDEHKQIIDLLEEKKPKAVIAANGKHPLCGLEPFPLFEDGNFNIPSAYVDKETAQKILEQAGAVELKISSQSITADCGQLVAIKRSAKAPKGKIVICAHMDTKYGTDGAVDNAAGVAVLMAAMERLKDYEGSYDIEFVPFNGEEYYEVKGELLYSEYLKNTQVPVKLAINIDGACHRDSLTAVSTYNFDEEMDSMLSEEMEGRGNIISGPQWYAGDHSMFIYGGIPCIAVTSSNLYGEVLDLTHTARDTIDQVSCELIEQTADFLAELARSAASEKQV